MINQQFQNNGQGSIGCSQDGRITSSGFTKVSGYDLLSESIEEIQDPSYISLLIYELLAGDSSKVGVIVGSNCSGLRLLEEGVSAELDLPDNSYAVKITFDKFLPILRDWKDAWDSKA
jgi:hypothetical protein